MGTAFGSAGTYMTYQLQQIAYASVGVSRTESIEC
jgi:hypothetical protein